MVKIKHTKSRIRACRAAAARSWNDFWHTGQVCGRSPVWTRRWVVTPDRDLNTCGCAGTARRGKVAGGGRIERSIVRGESAKNLRRFGGGVGTQAWPGPPTLVQAEQL